MGAVSIGIRTKLSAVAVSDWPAPLPVLKGFTHAESEHAPKAVSIRCYKTCCGKDDFFASQPRLGIIEAHPYDQHLGHPVQHQEDVHYLTRRNLVGKVVLHHALKIEFSPRIKSKELEML